MHEQPTNSAAATVIEPALIDEREAAAFLSLSPRMFRELLRRGEIQSIRVPGVRRVAYDVTELRELVVRWKRASRQPGTVSA